MSKQTSPPPSPSSIPDRQELIEIDLTVQIMAVSAALIGVCVTVLSIFRGFQLGDMNALLIDEILAIDAIIFLVCCVGAYVALRLRKRKRQLMLERAVDILFLIGMALMAFGCIGVVVEMR
jgi:hypothetical protein